MKRFNDFLQVLVKHEKTIFLFILIFNLLPVLVSKYTLTVDGPAHLYNARLIVDLLENPNGILNGYFVFNNSFSPNWSGHIILGVLLKFLPAYLAEKTLIISYLVLFPIGFRMLLMTLKPEAKYFVYFIIPFTHSFLFYYGFYNFHIGIVILFFTLTFWFRQVKKENSYYSLFIIGLLSCIIFFSHVFIYSVLLLILFISSATVLSEIKDKKKRKLKLISYSKSLIAFIPSLAFFMFYLSTLFKRGETAMDYLSLKSIFGMFYHVEPAKALIYSKEEIFTKWVFILILIFLIYQLISYFRNSTSKSSLVSKQWRNILLVVTACVFIFPNGTSEFGFISTRFILFIYFVLFIFLATLKYPKWLLIVSLLIINYVNIALVKVYFNKNKEFTVYAEAYIEASKIIKKYSTLLPINTSKEEWLTSHSSNYLGVDNTIIIKDNYEAYLTYFPLKWRGDNLNSFHLDSDELLLSKNSINQVDYVFCYGKQPNQYKIDSLLQNNYKMVYTNQDVRMMLYIKN